MSSAAEAIGKQLALLGLLILFVGISATQGYMDQLGLSSRVFNVSAQQFVYRGVVLLADVWWLIPVYVSAALWLALSDRAVHASTVVRKRPRIHTLLEWIKPNQLTTYVVIALFLAVTFLPARAVGTGQARIDLTQEISRLPLITSLQTDDGEQLLEDVEFRLVIADSTWVIVVAALENPDYESHNLHYYAAGEVRYMRTDH